MEYSPKQTEDQTVGKVVRMGDDSRGKLEFILGLILSDFRLQGDLSTIATVPDHHSNKTCWHWDSFRYPKLFKYAVIEHDYQQARSQDF